MNSLAKHPVCFVVFFLIIKFLLILYLNSRCFADELKWNHVEIVLIFVMKALF